MKQKTKPNASLESPKDELKPEYRFDYEQSKPNRFAGRVKPGNVVMLDDDVASVFRDSQAVNHALRTILEALPAKTSRRSPLSRP